RRNVTVFHSLFLRACERRRSSGSVCLGHYVLPPVCVQDVVVVMVVMVVVVVLVVVMVVGSSGGDGAGGGDGGE
ncbi:hypothetical protein CRUP_013638, partial [Coryphaenoides rupestris]